MMWDNICHGLPPASHGYFFGQKVILRGPWDTSLCHYYWSQWSGTQLIDIAIEKKHLMRFHLANLFSILYSRFLSYTLNMSLVTIIWIFFQKTEAAS